MSFESIVTERLTAITNLLNSIIANSKTNEEYPEQTTLEPASNFRVSNAGVSQHLKIQRLLDYFQSLGYITLQDIYQANIILESSYYWVEDYTYRVVYVKWIKDSEFHEFHFNQNFILSDAHATLDRIDIIALNTDSETIEIVEGTPASEPSPPALNENQLQITFVPVGASTTAPTGVTETLVYNENGQEIGGEFDTSTNNPTDIIFNYPDEFESGALSIKCSNIEVDDWMNFDKSTTLDIEDYSVLVFRIKLLNAINHKLQISLRTQSPDASIFVINILHGNYGFDINNLSTWQTIVVPLHGNIVASLATDFDRIRIANKQANASFLIDNIVLQSGTEGSSGEDGDFLPRGGYAGTAQNLKDEIDAIGATPGIITLTGDGVDNTDPDNPVMDLSNWQQTSEKGSPNGYAGLDGTGKVPAAQLPSYVDDVLEFADLASFPVTGETGKIYIALDTNKTYRWSGSVYVEISSPDIPTENQIEYQTEITANTTLDGSQKGLNKVYPVNNASARTITITTGDYVENDVINIERRGQGSVEIIADTGVRIRGVRDIDNRYFINDPNSMVALLCRGSEEFVIIGNLKRGYTGAPTVTSYSTLREGDTGVNLTITGTGLKNALVTFSNYITVNSIVSNTNTQIVLDVTVTGVEDDTVSVTLDNGDLFVDTDAITIQEELPEIVVYQDDFSGGSVDTTIWDIVTTANGSIAQTGGNLVLSSSGITSAPNYFGLILKNAVSSANDLIIVQSKVTFTNTGNMVTRFGLTPSTYDEFDLAVFTRQSISPYNRLRALIVDNSTAEINVNTDQDSGVDVRIKYTPSSGNTVFEYWNGLAWSEFSSTNGNIDLGTSVKALLITKCDASPAAPVLFDDFYICNDDYSTQYPV